MAGSFSMFVQFYDYGKNINKFVPDTERQKRSRSKAIRLKNTQQKTLASTKTQLTHKPKSQEPQTKHGKVYRTQRAIQIQQKTERLTPITNGQHCRPSCQRILGVKLASTKRKTVQEQIRNKTNTGEQNTTHRLPNEKPVGNQTL